MIGLTVGWPNPANEGTLMRIIHRFASNVGRRRKLSNRCPQAPIMAQWRERIMPKGKTVAIPSSNPALAAIVRWIMAVALPAYYANPYKGKGGDQDATPWLHSHYGKSPCGDGCHACKRYSTNKQIGVLLEDCNVPRVFS